MTRALGLLFFFLVLLWLYAMSYAQAQEKEQEQEQGHHAQHHPSYNNWVNQQDRGCCNNQDCGELAEQNERVTAAGAIEVRIEGEWCPVMSWHYLKRGNAPDWSSSHVCVQKSDETIKPSVCARLLCYQPKPGS